MTVDVPTPADLKAKLPYFAGVDDTVMADTITEAGRSVDDSWIVGDQKNAIMYLAAHLLFVLGATSTGGAPPGGVGGSGVVQSQSIGDASVSFAVNSYMKGSGDLQDDYRSTIWGRQYLRLLRLNQPAVGIV
jgi:hypothetical protein